MILEVRRIRIRSVFLFMTTLYGIVGLLVGVVLAVVATLEVPPGTEANLLSRLGVWSAVVFPVLYGLIGGFTGAIAAALYNAAASLVGGIRIEVPEARIVQPGREAGEAP